MGSCIYNHCWLLKVQRHSCRDRELCMCLGLRAANRYGNKTPAFLAVCSELLSGIGKMHHTVGYKSANYCLLENKGFLSIIIKMVLLNFYLLL